MYLSTIKTHFKKIPDFIWLSVVFFVTHLPSLTLLPVFADEAIYIRWAQLIQDDLGRYAFFSMSDGKPPLFMWTLSLALHLSPDPLWAGRFLSLLIGAITMFVIYVLTLDLTAKKQTARIAGVAVIILPFWFFYSRMALMDGLLTLLLTSAFFFVVKISKSQHTKYYIRYTFLFALTFGLALMTKTPALFAIPIFAIVPLFFLKKFNLRPFMYILLGGLLAGLLFLSLRVSPLFGSLFARENDFTFSLRDLLTGQWHYVVSTSIWRNLYWIASYVTPGWLVLAVSGLFFIRTKKNVLLLLLSAVIFAAPLTILGRVLYPRYFLPVVPFLTIAGAIGLGELLQTTKYRFFGWLLAAFALLGAMQFIIPSFADIAHIPFVMEDKIQYLSEWSAGFGNSEVRDFVINEQKKLPSDGSEKIIVLTEGAFGTLPDGLLMYFHEPGSAKNLEIHGIGVGPSVIPQEYLDRARTNEVFYMVNSHRFKVADPSILQKVFEVPRPLNGPKLVLYRVL